MSSESATDAPVVAPRKIRVGPPREHDRKTQVDVEKKGDTVEKICVTCRCGEATVIRCSYPDTTA